jgi:signal transduction histidine kinase
MPLAIPSNPCADALAADFAHASAELRRASKVLHDDVGSQLAAAGLRLQMLRLDVPATEPDVAAVMEALDGAMESVRTLSLALDPSPTRVLGLSVALRELAESYALRSRSKVVFKHTASAVLPAEVADKLYQATALTLAATPAAAQRVAISTTGSRGFTVRIQTDCSLPRVGQDLIKAALLAKHAGLAFGIRSGKVTIISIRYAIRRSVG